jgi:hypothetical protein
VWPVPNLSRKDLERLESSLIQVLRPAYIGRVPATYHVHTDQKEHEPVNPAEQWAWRERGVDPAEDHFELRYGSAQNSGWDSWVPVARVGRPLRRVFGVEFLISRPVPESRGMFDAVVKELDFYLVTKREKNPWTYAQYHCTTAANVYSWVHWSFHNRRPEAIRAALTRRRRAAGTSLTATRPAQRGKQRSE